ncbi:unnamed protein product [Rangifer tarandus platyrhynchus]|uniref:Uncharacterized protein n=2 Tax=Rangifer tarandus platyrhynchus TaxID=3082113 RepID=A0ABN8XYG3_RANTA|nr:unnamed protein product [Rangifer tarandus platyrhynchus]
MREHKPSSKSVESAGNSMTTAGEPNPNPEQARVTKETVTLSLMEEVQGQQPATWQLAPPPELFTALHIPAGHSVRQIKILGVLVFFSPYHSPMRMYCAYVLF